MRSVHSVLILAVGALFGAPACTEVDPQPGQLGGPCRASFTPCDDGLVCNGNGCERPSGSAEPDIDVTFTFKDGKGAVQADGQDNTILIARFFQTANGLTEPAPENLQFRMWVDPPQAGTLEFSGASNPEVTGDDGLVPFRIVDANGAATVRFTGCDKALPGCIRFATIRVAIAPDVLSPVAGVAIENIGAGAVARPVDPEDPEEVPTPPLPDGFGPIEKCTGVMNRMYLQGDETARIYQGTGDHFEVDSWQLLNGIRQDDTDDMILKMDSDTLGASVIITVNTTQVGEPLDAREYDPAVDTAVIEEGVAQFNITLIKDGVEAVCSRAMERRFAVQSLRIAAAKVEHLALSFVQACDGGIIQGCLNIAPIDMAK